MQLIVRSSSTHVIDVSPEANVEVLRKQLALLEGEMSLAGLENQAVDLTVPLKGGKVHGSLARAGKVRGQTPKVEAAEKKKKKTGRAKRRIQYVRRFVNVVETFGGRKKGPNSNSE